jgi:UDP-N-acetylmuramate dehydrogenase
MDKTFQYLNERLSRQVLPDVPLSQYTTFKIGGRAKYFFLAHSQNELVAAVKTAQDMSLPYFIIGGGSNLWVSDRGFEGLVIKNGSRDIAFEQESVVVDSGVTWGVLLVHAHEKGIIGMEEFSHIPGTIGGAVYGNAGSMGKETQELVKRVLVRMPESHGNVEWMKNEECGFSYRNSIFKQKPSVILKVELQLAYGDVAESEEKVKVYLQKRRETQPIDRACAGCIFKNPPGLFASKLIDECGLKGYRVGGARISTMHANFIENVENATSADVKKLIERVKEIVLNKHGVRLEEEVIKVGF